MDAPPILHPPAKKRSQKKWFIIGGAALLAVAVAVPVILKNRAPAITVQTDKVTRRNMTEIVTANGKIQPVVQVTISPEVSGEITELDVKEGQQVKKGDLLLKIKPDFYVAALNQARAGYESSLASRDSAAANLEKAEADYKRNLELFHQNLIPESDFIGYKVARDMAFAELESATNQVSMTKAGVDSARDSLDKTTIYSPIDGTVVQLNSQVGERVLGTVQNAGTEIMTIADLSQIEARVDVGEMDVVSIHPGQKAQVEVDAFKDKKFTGTVTQIANSIRSSRQSAAYSTGQSQSATTFTVRVRLNESEDFRPGMSVTADIETRYRTNALTVPLAAVTTRPKLPEKHSAKTNSVASTNKIAAATNSVSSTNALASTTNGVAATNAFGVDRKSKEAPSRMDDVIFVVEGDHVKQVPVKIGICDDNYWEITSGLTNGEEIVIGGYKAISKDLRDGAKIKKGFVADAKP
ncbi:MAG TPA: efflux RND transporter periplasmic adaptor subunit [Verrucomicrobiae bacterium]|nr:efflux RND transporter periplasmic adaptor subunit [Verrucomicrobiae bacterium]